MSEDGFRYDLMVEDALRGVVRTALIEARDKGLPGNHHFYITFKTQFEGVRIPPYLAERYADEMTIVLQFQFWDLEVHDDHLAVTLSFNDQRERLIVPYEAMTAFADPSVQFGLQFASSDDEGSEPTEGEEEAAMEEQTSDAGDSDNDPNDDSPGPDSGGSGEVVSLDQFRKKK